MEHLDHPDEREWEERRLWFEGRQAGYAEAGATRVSEQASALLIELQAVFCAGAWVAAIILAMAVVEAQSRVSKGLPWLRPRDLKWLQTLRNKLIHEKLNKPAFTVQDHWLRRDFWEGRARRAIEIAFAATYPQSELQEDGAPRDE